MTKVDTLLTDEHIRAAIKVLKTATPAHLQMLFWVDNESFYLKSKLAKDIGFDCTVAEIEAAKSDPTGFIKMASGVKLFLSQYVRCN